ncbi:hypothetical protein [Carboxylicivirga linearis]|uniref:Outer membrane protein beta-barrel domain-containing protein n=1 Tax=Carboxylicivirga linearis TaxID=1628157 RepID=A0ABS5JTN7_9BACT|nr:hypothetical protein [Carboxylicivirga linearis]MBS2098283.1 hypothetical protein [Carboxylicivirga linearis]
MRRLLFFVLILVCAKINLLGQSDFRPGCIITHSLDTVHGMVDYRGDIRNMKVCSFKKQESEMVTEYLAKDIFGYRFDEGKFYISKYIESESVEDTVFVEFLLSGIRNLYYYKNHNFSAYYVDDGEGSLLELENNEVNIKRNGTSYIYDDQRYRGMLTYIFQDCPELKSDINKTNLSHKSLINITKKYHDYKCDDEVCIIYEKELPVFTIEVEPSIGYSLASLTFNDGYYFNEMDFTASHSAQLGVTLNMKLPKLNEKMSLAFSGLLNKDYFYATSSDEYWNNRVVNNYYHVHTFNLLTGMELRYTYPKGNVRPEIFAGGFINYLLDSEVKYEVENVISSTVSTKYAQLDVLEKSYQGLMGGIGLKYRLFTSLTVFNRLRYNHYINSEKNGVETVISSLNITMGVIF